MATRSASERLPANPGLSLGFRQGWASNLVATGSHLLLRTGSLAASAAGGTPGGASRKAAYHHEPVTESERGRVLASAERNAFLKTKVATPRSQLAGPPAVLTCTIAKFMKLPIQASRNRHEEMPFIDGRVISQKRGRHCAIDGCCLVHLLVCRLQPATRDHHNGNRARCSRRWSPARACAGLPQPRRLEHPTRRNSQRDRAPR